MRKVHAAAVFAGLLLAALHAAAADPPKVQGQFTRDGKTYAFTHVAAWQAARPDALVVVLSDAEVPLMDVRHLFRLKQLAEEGKVHGLRFEFDPTHLDLRYVYGRFMTPEWGTYSVNGSAWQRLVVADGRIAGKLEAGGAQVEFDVPVVGGTGVETLTGPEAQHSPQVDTLIGYEDAARKGDWKQASKYLTPMAAELLKRDVSTPQGLGQFKAAGKYMKDLLAQGEARRKEIEKVIISGDDASAVGPGFAADFVLIGGRWLKI